ncbi:DUF5372 family protein [Streptomyces sp. TRM68416]|uniref:DUF5372 family protein n=1 Tax=Streptomyces sp. TRM68416 TaxID=2758412 RepID=UPI0016618C0F|nr:DUF5372 family protein [Streptomyces sp. TRM68416]MBD0843999.1 hypothetical protein [Streptomyces sp. TRM68416]
MGSLVVRHPFHPLAGRRLVVLFTKRRAGATVFVCASGVSRSVTLLREWTDRAEEPAGHRLSAEGLSAARALIDALVSRRAGTDEGGS